MDPENIKEYAWIWKKLKNMHGFGKDLFFRAFSQDMQLGLAEYVVVEFYQNMRRSSQNCTDLYFEFIGLCMLSVLETHHRNRMGSTQSQILFLKCSCLTGADQPAWSSTPGGNYCSFGKDLSSHILHYCLNVRLWWCDEHQSLFQDKHLVEKNWISFLNQEKSPAAPQPVLAGWEDRLFPQDVFLDGKSGTWARHPWPRRRRRPWTPWKKMKKRKEKKEKMNTLRPPLAQQRRGNAVWKTKAPCSF